MEFEKVLHDSRLLFQENVYSKRNAKSIDFDTSTHIQRNFLLSPAFPLSLVNRYDRRVICSKSYKSKCQTIKVVQRIGTKVNESNYLNSIINIPPNCLWKHSPERIVYILGLLPGFLQHFKYLFNRGRYSFCHKKKLFFVSYSYKLLKSRKMNTNARRVLWRNIFQKKKKNIF